MFKISQIIDGYKTSEITETDFKMMVLKIRQVILDSDLTSIVKNKRTEGMKQSVESVKSFQDQKQVSRILNNAEKVKSSILTKDSLKNL